ncbi:hypothetical protein T265_11955 [Opisthorchis viverrini]|uniref:Uncharacterized protein n=1 Tax=Opisthorchis viverrini TaxID=6198 RepID=A0A074YX28_OPIVI|nr:hypothetical protein T265_11955 [Opisthorchis viverrini]KER19188.1 hypothetical protein T265_11955 [Opisthorchis viverrini]
MKQATTAGTSRHKTKFSFNGHYQHTLDADGEIHGGPKSRAHPTLIYLHLIICSTKHSHARYRGTLLLDVAAHTNAPTPFSHGAIAVSINLPVPPTH